MRLDPSLGWGNFDMRMEYVGARASYDSTIDRVSDDMAKQVYKARSKFTNCCRQDVLEDEQLLKCYRH